MWESERYYLNCVESAVKFKPTHPLSAWWREEKSGPCECDRQCSSHVTGVKEGVALTRCNTAGPPLRAAPW